jgi:two-component system, chemotaxis family, protein-glutamate methylesterase/glutaminase
MSYGLIVVGASLGGFHALEILLGDLPGDFPLPVAVAQHRSSDSDELLPSLLARRSRLPVAEAEDKQHILPGHVYIAPANYHLLIEEGHFALSTEGPVQFARPSVDVLFESAADAYRDKVVGVLLSGSNRDGARGLALIKEYGGLAIVQDPASAESRHMPEAAIASTRIDHVLPLPEIARLLTELVSRTEVSI